LGSTNGAYIVLIGLRGFPTNATATWQGIQLTLNATPFVLTVTNPVGPVVSQPLIQVQGYAARPLSSLTFGVSNAAGIFTNQTGYILSQYYDPNSQAFTTNYFQCYDVRMASGLNIVTLHATDTEGDTTSASESFEYSPGTNPPALTVLWPQNGTLVSGSSFTLQGQVDDDTATVTAQITDTNGDINTVQGQVERNGLVWVNNLPLSPGTNTLTVTATNAAGISMTTNLTLVQSAVMVTIDPLSQLNQSSVSVTGTISDESYDVYVNGVEAYYLDMNGDWEADGVPVSPVGTATINVEVYSGDPILGGSESSSQDQPPMVVLKDYSYSDDDLFVQSGEYGVDETENTTETWDYQNGGGYNYLQVGSAVNDAHNWAPVYYTQNHAIGPDTTNDWFTFNPSWETASWSDPGNDQSTLMLTPSGKAVPGVTDLAVVEAQVTNEITGLQEPASEVQFTSQLPGTSAVDITNADGSVQTAALVAYPAGTMPAVTPKGNNISYNGTQSANLSLQIIDNNTENILSGQTNTVIVGQQMYLTCKLSVNNATAWNSMLTNFQWTVPGDTISNYVVEQDESSATVGTNFPTTNSSAVFYWLDGASNRVVRCSAMLGGITFSNQATFNIIRPTIDFTGTIGVVFLDTNCIYFPNTLSLHLGGTVNNGTTNYGITCLSTNPNLYGYDTNSSAGFIVAQIITNFSISYTSSNGSTASTNISGLDNSYPVENLGDGNNKTFYDAPADAIVQANLVQLSVTDSFSTFVMFIPDEPLAIPVPLRRVDWTWSGTASFTNGQWILTSPNSAITANNQNTLSFPTWTNVFRNYNLQ
jgi:hypothetical protein